MNLDDQSHPRVDAVLYGAIAVIMLSAFSYLVFGSDVFGNEFAGWGALFAIPFCFGAFITLAIRSYSPVAWLAAPVALLAISMTLVWLGVEGLICVAMVMPFWLAAGLGGGIAALYLVRRMRNEREDAPSTTRLNSVGLAIVPFLLIFAEGAAPPDWQERTVSRSVEIDATPEQIWPLLSSIPQVADDEGIGTFTHDWLGVPRPSDARLTARGDAMVREARWGEQIRFEEIVTAIDPAHRMEWRFVFPDASLQNHTDRHISPNGEILKITSGGYRIEPISDGKSHVILHTDYRMQTRMGWYFGWWGEQVIGDVQANVLAIIEQRASAAK